MRVGRFLALSFLLLILPVVSRGATVTAQWPDGLGYYLNVSYDDDGAGAASAHVYNIPVGMYFWDPVGTSNPSPFNKRFTSFCIDLDQAAQTPSTFTIKTLEEAPAGPGPGAVGSGPSSSFMSAQQANYIRELWGEHYSELRSGTVTQQNDKTCAFQLAIWEILFENSATKDPSNGYLKILYSGSPAYINLTNQYLNSTYDSGASALETRLVGLTSLSGQDHVTMVPLPRASIAGLALIGAVAFVRMRCNTRLTIPA